MNKIQVNLGPSQTTLLIQKCQDFVEKLQNFYGIFKVNNSMEKAKEE